MLMMVIILCMDNYEFTEEYNEIIGGVYCTHSWNEIEVFKVYFVWK